MLDGTVAAARHAQADLLCFSHLRWDFVYQRVQHLLSRAATQYRVTFWEEPVYTEEASHRLVTRMSPEGVFVVQPYVPWGADPVAAQREMLDGLIRERGIWDPVLWYYTPMALAFSGHLSGRPVVYDCMDELSAFAGADSELPRWERELMRRATLVFTGGLSLFEAKRGQHRAVYAFPSGVDVAHFAPARGALAEPGDQAGIGSPRVGFFGVLDERLDRGLLAAAAALRPDWHFVLVGPLAKLDEADLPRAANLHYLGPKGYDELPGYIAQWDVAMMPFALNEATRFISPTKTPEYLAAGTPVVSTPIADVARSWGETPYVAIAAEAGAFMAAADTLRGLPAEWRDDADVRLREMSWDGIWRRMGALVEAERRRGQERRARRVGGAGATYDVLIVGAGFAGSVLAERLAADGGKRVLLVDRRPHVGGNAYDRRDEAGILIHPYGPHIFHTNSPGVFEYLSRFTRWRAYAHKVLAQVGGQLLPMPINRETINRFFGVSLTSEEVEPFLRGKAEAVGVPRNSAEVVLGSVGREMYEAFFRGYTRKQWGLDPSELDKSVCSRVPVRTGDDDRYFLDRYQFMPLKGYTAMFEAMLAHPNITVATDVEYSEVDPDSYDSMVFTGPVDEFFGYRFGKLPYRSLAFRHETHDVERFQNVGVVNYPDPDVDYTRITEFKHLTGQVHARTSVCYEFPSGEGDPYYPVPREESAALYARYRALADATPGVRFVGRLATYRYYNMDQVVGQALATYARMVGVVEAVGLAS
jgi:UDP-galactopyranose mutase